MGSTPKSYPLKLTPAQKLELRRGLFLFVILWVLPVHVWHYWNHDVLLQRATDQFERTEAEAIKEMGQPQERITLAQIESGKVKWPPPRFTPAPLGQPQSVCLIYHRHVQRVLLYFGPDGKCYQVQYSEEWP